MSNLLSGLVRRLKKPTKTKKIGHSRSTSKKRPIPKKKAGASRATLRIKKRALGARRKSSRSKEALLGVVTHFYGHIKVAVIRVRVAFPAGAILRFRGATTDFAQTAVSLQYDHKPISRAPKGKQIGMKVRSRVRPGDRVYRET